MKLIDVLAREFKSEFHDTRAYKMKDVDVVAAHKSYEERWPGKHRNVHFWWSLANGYAVGFNENPARGWSFPVVKNEVKF
jgi:hypothetical protein